MQASYKDLPDRQGVNPSRRQGRHYRVPDFVRGRIKGSRKNHRFDGFLRHHGLDETKVTEGFRTLHRRVSGRLNKATLLFEKDVFKTYLHCMKKAYKAPLSETEKLVELLRCNKKFNHQNSPWHRLVALLESRAILPSLNDIVVKPMKKPEYVPKGDSTAIEVLTDGKWLPTGITWTRSVTSTGTLVFHASDEKLLEKDGNLYSYRGPYYGGTVLGGRFPMKSGQIMRFATPYKDAPHLYHRDEDREKGADALEELFSFLPRSNKPLQGFGGGKSPGLDSIAVRDSYDCDQIYDLVCSLKDRSAEIAPRSKIFYGISRVVPRTILEDVPDGSSR